MKIAIMGFGTVGSGAYEISKAVSDIELVRILARHGRKGYEELDGIITPNITDITQDPEIELVIESIGGTEPAREYVLACLNAGKHVVTPNKNLISAYGRELAAAAAENNVQLRYTATAGGGIPWLFNLLRTRRCDEILEIRGIVNGTCNYILDAMFDKGASFDEMLKTAQELGYAEADPSSDIEGTDTLRKTVISSNLAFDSAITEKDVPCFGIDTIDACDIEWMKANGYSCKLLMTARRTDKGITACVEPTLVKADSLEAGVKTNNNLISLTGKSIGTQSFFGQGAGALPTGESVIQDVIDIIKDNGRSAVTVGESTLEFAEDTSFHRYYIRQDEECGVSEPVTVAEMHRHGKQRKEEGRPIFFARLPEE